MSTENTSNMFLQHFKLTKYGRFTCKKRYIFIGPILQSALLYNTVCLSDVYICYFVGHCYYSFQAQTLDILSNAREFCHM